MDNQKLQRYQEVLKANEPNMLLSTANHEGVVSSAIITTHQSTDQPNVFYVVTNPESTKVKNIKQHPQVALNTWYNAKNGDRLSSNNATATVITDPKVLQSFFKDHPKMLETKIKLKEKALITITLKSAILASFTKTPMTTTISF